jgi:DNA uptake protein ComE-like DNA-binding protein
MQLRTLQPRRRSGSILVIVLWIAFGLVTVALYFGQSMTFELRASDNRVASLEAEQAINGVVRYLSTVLAQQTNGMMPEANLYQAENVAIGDATYWLIGRSTNQSTPSEKVAFGLIDEASKLNLNIATSNMLMNLPNMTPELAAAIIDWRRTSTEASVGGAKDETYTLLNPPYLCKNFRYETVDELHMIYGMDKELLYGEDVNLNGVMDANENDGDTTEPTDNRDGRLDPGYWEYFTTVSYEPTNRVDGSGKININQASQLTTLQTLLTDVLSDRATRVMTSIRARISPPQQQQGPGQGQGQAAPVQARPFTSLMDVFTTVSSAGITADDFALFAQDIYIPPSGTGPVASPVNINTASEIVLSCIPGIGITNAASVIAYRESNPTALTSVAWLVDAIGSSAATSAGRYVTVYSYQFTADIAAVGHNNQGYRRVRFTFDLTDSFPAQSPPRIIYRQDLTHLGWALGKQVRQNLLLAKESR